jgi:hypothetical protein
MRQEPTNRGPLPSARVSTGAPTLHECGHVSVGEFRHCDSFARDPLGEGEDGCPSLGHAVWGIPSRGQRIEKGWDVGLKGREVCCLIRCFHWSLLAGTTAGLEETMPDYAASVTWQGHQP